MDNLQNEIWVANFLVQETGTYAPQFRRPYEIQSTGDNLQQLSNRVDQLTHNQPLAKIDSSVIAGLSSGLVLPKAQPDSQIYIPNGFQEPRLRFILEVHVKSRFAQQNLEVYIFQGWSDHVGVSHGGHIDDHMRFDINSFVRISRGVDYSNLAGGGYRDIIVEQAQVINGEYYTQDAFGNIQKMVYGLRPTDVFCGIHSCHYQNAMAMDNYEHRLNDTRQNIATDMIRSRRQNAIPSNYLSHLINDARTAQATADFGSGTEDIYTRAQMTSYETPLGENPLISALSHVIGLDSVTFFTFRDLLKIDSSAVQRTHYQPVATSYRLNQAGDTDGWAAGTMDNSLATMLINAVHSLMVQHMLVSIGFDSTNETINGMPFSRIHPDTVQGFTNADLTQHQQLFLRRLETEIVPDLTLNGLRRYNFVMFADLYNDTTLQLSFDGGPVEYYISPTFADSLLAPVVTTNESNYHGMITGIEAVANQVGFQASGPSYGIDMTI